MKKSGKREILENYEYLPRVYEGLSHFYSLFSEFTLARGETDDNKRDKSGIAGQAPALRLMKYHQIDYSARSNTYRDANGKIVRMTDLRLESFS